MTGMIEYNITIINTNNSIIITILWLWLQQWLYDNINVYTYICLSVVMVIFFIITVMKRLSSVIVVSLKHNNFGKTISKIKTIKNY